MSRVLRIAPGDDCAQLHRRGRGEGHRVQGAPERGGAVLLRAVRLVRLRPLHIPGACVRVCAWVCVCVSVGGWVRGGACGCVGTCMCVWLCVCAYGGWVCGCLRACMWVRVGACVCVQVGWDEGVNVCARKTHFALTTNLFLSISLLLPCPGVCVCRLFRMKKRLIRSTCINLWGGGKHRIHLCSCAKSIGGKRP